MRVAETAGGFKRILPPRILSHLRACRDLDARGRARYLALQFRRCDPVRRWDEGGVWSAVRSVVCVCRGNIIRSPMAAALLRRRLSEKGTAEIAVFSAGLRAQPGRGADPRAVEAARRFGISLADHRARPLSAGLVGEADLILVMDSLNEADLRGRWPEAAGRILRLGSFLQRGRRRPVELFDPYDGAAADVRRCYELVDSAIECLVSRLGSGGGAASEEQERRSFR